MDDDLLFYSAGVSEMIADEHGMQDGKKGVRRNIKKMIPADAEPDAVQAYKENYNYYYRITNNERKKKLKLKEAKKNKHKS